MTLTSPEWLFLIPLLAAVGWKWRFLRLHEPLRFMLLIVLIAALCGPVARLGNGDMDLWLLVDQSDSTAQKPAIATLEIIDILEGSKRAGDRIRVVDFGKDAVIRERGDTVFRGGTSSTRIGRAIDYVLAQAESDRVNRLLVATDGYPTDSLDGTTEQLVSQGIVADSRIFRNSFDTDYRVADVRYPNRVRPGEAFLIEFSIFADETVHGPVEWEIRRDNAEPLKGTVTLNQGKGRVRVTDRLTSPGAAAYTLNLLPPESDPVPQNNSARIWIEVAGGSRVLIASRYANDPLASFLREQGIDTVVVTDPASLRVEHLSGVRLLVVNDVLASAFSQEFLEAVDFFVREQGNGLLMCGGRNSFGAGGYYSSPLDPLLPVSMELRNEHRKLISAMSFVLDRSGSMSVSTAGGRTKMDLANAGTSSAIGLLSDQDFVSVHAVDSSPHVIAAMTNVGGNRAAILNAVGRIRSMGGGIFVEEGIKAGWRELKKTDAGTRHLILFSDAADSEEPGDYKTYLAKMRKEGITLSVIALGSRSDPDSKLLEDIASLGGGRLFFSTDGSDLPSIFSQETVSVARSAFIEEITSLKATGGWAQVAARTPAWPDTVAAYNLSYLKEGATTACVSGDEYQAPLVAFWSKGAGRAAAVSFPMAGEKAGSILQWPGYGDFVQTLARWLMGNGNPEGFSLRTSIGGEHLELELLYSDENIPVIAATAPRSVIELSSEGDLRTIEGVWEHIEPGRFRCSLLVDDGQYLRGAVRVGEQAIPFGPVSTMVNAEWEMNAAKHQEFLDMIALSGGRERHNLPEIWETSRPVRQREMAPYLVWSAFGLALADALLSRLGVSLLPGRTRRMRK